ncbi:hypothetical protein M427DRAFT_36712 [Gonapodya prolifera JEL478]|uniref:Major facilitator superfamily (MFS) profile domain-containing protein n=1 Tax=Gonapodya prolifera (strain JEL478) TaxID=1344416 RepID=A0A139A1S9_GONPJ|nr:hypothetical protein M427DRAFT_36712 [Gonapodya prolifera JEL478]|eukprot:KXS10701.1 hypothetical protein M427DRAFT_36712 [Gonapodya prolifera JEL478]
MRHDGVPRLTYSVAPSISHPPASTFPSDLRTSALGICQTCSKLGTTLAPLFIHATGGQVVPMAYFAAAGVLVTWSAGEGE